MTKKIMFGAGCFWGVEEVFRTLNGVKGTAVGYAGGHTENPTYKEVCTGTTGHAEVVLIEYDSAEVSFEKLLEIFWKSHNPTCTYGQGPDVGSEYRSAVYYYDDEQRDLTVKSKEMLEMMGRYINPIVTEIKPAEKFYPAEDYHQKFFMKRGGGTCGI